MQTIDIWRAYASREIAISSALHCNVHVKDAMFSAVAEIRVALSCETDSSREAIEAQIVAELDSYIRNGSIERDEPDIERLNRTRAKLGNDAQLAAVRQTNGGLTAYVICQSAAAVEGLRKLYTGGELRNVLEETFVGLLRYTMPVVVGGLDWSSQNYDDCLEAMRMTTGNEQFFF